MERRGFGIYKYTLKSTIQRDGSVLNIWAFKYCRGLKKINF